ncbi:histidine phosphatase family protein [Candidatus Falkowbacteria bacterium]|nr:histidine phosphatase family protein [Candidatus Falkowbacteria bacterium]
MSVTITYFVHGTTTDNERGIASGWTDVGLSALGVEQSQQLRSQTAKQRFDVVFCSDLKRAVDSAELAFSGSAPIIPDARLRECNYGEYNGQPSLIVEPLQQQYITEPFPGGESYEAVTARVNDWLSFFRQNYNGQRVAVVGHRAPQLALDVLLQGKTWQQAFSQDWRATKAWQPGWEYLVAS